MAADLDLTGHFSPKYTSPEPVASAEAARDIDKLGLIGEAALKEKGYFTRMVVEDRTTNRKILNLSRVRVLIVEALSVKPLPHLALLDVVMPDANGFDVLNRIRHHPELKDLPVLMLTALGDRKDITRGLTLGADGYLTKPVLPSVLLQAVETLLAG